MNETAAPEAEANDEFDVLDEVVEPLAHSPTADPR